MNLNIITTESTSTDSTGCDNSISLPLVTNSGGEHEARNLDHFPSNNDNHAHHNPKLQTTAARRKVSFEDESLYFFDFESTLLSQENCILKEENRVVSNETIHGTTHHASTNSNTNITTTAITAARSPRLRKNNSKSLSSLTRSGNLKLLFETASPASTFRQIQIPAVSEDGLSSRVQDDDMLHSALSFAGENDSCHCACPQQAAESTSSPTPSSTSYMPDSTPCTGWGQFVDFITPSERQALSSSARDAGLGGWMLQKTSAKHCKRRLPARRRSKSFSGSSRHTQYRFQKHCKQQLRHSKQQSPKLYINNNNSCSNSPKATFSSAISDVEMLDAFKFKLSITQE